ncbi:hypothetical protein Gasu_36040 isoform 1 [Galdieria sulphuraria]|uniref:START domain-containing protein n=1 Tax=Galdieria sulphuraria TaxID=130081 RepID=M2W0A5_GALSU|nr:hypothetical protein Gasu_36040 isoform 1 [Galdieria sulphuraria]EME29036.1 hypothetical protein isoform 1 [Galdieria sulphuraria]|eukprot:XP_005705556.1 hypothetical protein isoform 1 [Galdieria sulphuraria]
MTLCMSDGNGMMPCLETSKVVQVASEVLQDTVELAFGKEEGNWEFLKVKNNIRICRKKTGSLHTFRGVGKVSYPLEQILPVATCVESRPSWDPLCKEGKLIRKIDNTYSLVWWSFHGVLVISDRDFCLALAVKEISEDGTVCISTRSVEDASCPSFSGYVRGYANVAGILLKPCENSQDTLVTYIGNVDPKGMLPHWAVNIGGEKGAMCIHYLQCYLEQHAASTG